MVIIAHRGHWKNDKEHNTVTAFQRALGEGFGIETDVRDQNGEIVIAHDMPTGKCFALSELLALHQKENPLAWLAINIKSSELAGALAQVFDKFQVKNYFLFDAAVPDALKLHHKGLKIFTRHSDIEPEPALYEASAGVWMDEMLAPWITETAISQHLKSGKKVCVVSPELHGRNYAETWKTYLKISIEKHEESLMVCTDLPEKLEGFLLGKDNKHTF